MTTPDYLVEHEGALIDAETEAEYQREIDKYAAGREGASNSDSDGNGGPEAVDTGDEDAALPADMRLTELEDKLYLGNLTTRNVRDAFRE